MNIREFKNICFEKIMKEYYGKYSENSKKLCELEEGDFTVDMNEIMGWLIVRYRGEVKAYPLIILPPDFRGYKFGTSEAVNATVALGYSYYSYKNEELPRLYPIDHLGSGYDVVGLLSARPNTYYIIGKVINRALGIVIEFVLDIKNLDDIDIDKEKEAEMTEAERRAEKLKKLEKEMKVLLMKTYLEWLQEDTVRKYIDELMKI